MALGTHTFTGSSLSFTFQRGDVYPFTPARRRVQVASETAGGKLYVQDRGQEIVIYSLVFDRLTKQDHDNLVAFWRTDVLASKDKFTWNDLDNSNHQVRMVNNPLEIAEVGHDGLNPVYSATVVLREEL